MPTKAVRSLEKALGRERAETLDSRSMLALTVTSSRCKHTYGLAHLWNSDINLYLKEISSSRRLCVYFGNWMGEHQILQYVDVSNALYRNHCWFQLSLTCTHPSEDPVSVLVSQITCQAASQTSVCQSVSLPQQPSPDPLHIRQPGHDSRRGDFP